MKERAFVIDRQLQELLSTSNNQNNNQFSRKIEGNNQSKVSMQAIVNAVMFPSSPQSQKTLKLVNASDQYLNWYKLILATFTSLYSPSQVAASSVKNETCIVNRQGRGFTIKVLQEAPEDKEAYLILSIDSSSPRQREKGVFMHCMWKQQFYVIPFGLPTKNEIQVLINTRDTVFKAITNTESHLYLT